MHSAELPFKFELPFEVFHKAGEKGKERRIGGIISTDRVDRQGEVVLQRGLDFSEFISNGWFNDNHSRDTTGIVGYPEVVRKTTHKGRPAHYVEGYLLEGFDRADKIWELANALQKTGRRLGFSIEGGITRREGAAGKTIATAKVRNVAITNCAVNTDTGLEVLAKSLQCAEAEGDEWLRRGMMAGQAIANPGTAPGEGFPLRAESMERKPKRKRKLSKAEAVEFLCQRYPGMTTAKATRILNYVAARGEG
jgi:hypothetical protein